MAFQVKGYVTTIVLLLIAFTIGLNLGLHGVIAFERSVSAPVATTNIDQPASQLSTSQSDSTHKYATSTVSKTRNDGNVAVVPEQRHTETPAKNVAKEPVRENKNGLDAKMIEVRALVAAYAANKHLEVSARLPELAATAIDIPIVLLTCNRAALLQQTLESLMQVRGVKKENVIISQDGALQEVADIAKKSGFTLIQNLNGIRLRGGAAQDGASRIAQHYKYSLTSVFERMKDAQAVIVIEDDLLFSPDMYEYLLSVAPILHADPTAFVVSAWSDNGFKNKVHEPYALRRTDYFPGLGWLLTRKLYKDELEPRWPASHWDHWLRSAETSKHRDIIYPQVCTQVVCATLE